MIGRCIQNRVSHILAYLRFEAPACFTAGAGGGGRFLPRREVAFWAPRCGQRWSMRHGRKIASAACALALIAGTNAALAQQNNSTNATGSTYQAAQAAGAAAQKVAPPNLVLPADMGGGTWSQKYAQNTNNAATPNGTMNNGAMPSPSPSPSATPGTTSTMGAPGMSPSGPAAGSGNGK